MIGIRNECERKRESTFLDRESGLQEVFVGNLLAMTLDRTIENNVKPIKYCTPHANRIVYDNGGPVQSHAAAGMWGGLLA